MIETLFWVLFTTGLSAMVIGIIAETACISNSRRKENSKNRHGYRYG